MPNSMNTMQGCCCDDCCDDEGGPPTADFSYEQTDDDPCTIDLFDESTDGTCGEIVSWSWKLNDVEFSTSQNPTGVEVEDGDEITLEVIDSSGCTDSAVMVIECDDLSACEFCSDMLPSTCSVTPDFDDPVGPTCACPGASQEWTATLQGICGGDVVYTGGICGGDMRIIITIDATHIYARFEFAGNVIVFRTTHTSGTACRGTYNLTPFSESGCCCDGLSCVLVI